MAELFDAVNFLEIQNAKDGNRNESRLRDLEGRAKYLSKQTGQEPVSWYEFTREIPPEKPNTLGNAAIGAGVGAALLGILPFVFSSPITVPLIVTGAVFGGLAGGYHKTENTARSKQVDAYETYLNQFEKSAGRGLAPAKAMQADTLVSQMDRINAGENKFAEQLKERRDAEKTGCGSCKGH